jgi:hypothetical protein
VPNHQDIVASLKAEHPDLFASTDLMLLFVLLVLSELPPAEKAGLVKAPPGGENVAFYQGIPVRVNRVIYPDGQIVKILTNSGPGGLNGPAWNMDDVRPDLYVPVTSDPPPPPPPPPVVNLEPRVAALETLFASLEGALNTTQQALTGVTKRVDTIEHAPPPVIELPALVAKGNTNRVWGHAHTVELDVTKKESA